MCYQDPMLLALDSFMELDPQFAERLKRIVARLNKELQDAVIDGIYLPSDKVFIRDDLEFWSRILEAYPFSK